MVIKAINMEPFSGITENDTTKAITFGLTDQDKYDLFPDYTEYYGHIHMRHDGSFVVSVDMIDTSNRESLLTCLDARKRKELELLKKALESDFMIPRDAYVVL